VGHVRQAIDRNHGREGLTGSVVKAFEQADLESGQPHHFNHFKNASKETKENRLVAINTFVWGRILWTANHLLASTYPENPTLQTQEDAIQFFKSQASLLPCQEECAPAWREELERNPPDVSSRHALMEWLRLRHNAVNAKLGGPQYSRDDMLAALAEQKGALSAVIYYAKKEDHEALRKNVSIQARVEHEWAKFVKDPNMLAAILTGVILGLVMLILWICTRCHKVV
jgi:hypothetical protein